jgi:hypothetical protein
VTPPSRTVRPAAVASPPIAFGRSAHLAVAVRSSAPVELKTPASRATADTAAPAGTPPSARASRAWSSATTGRPPCTLEELEVQVEARRRGMALISKPRVASTVACVRRSRRRRRRVRACRRSRRPERTCWTTTSNRVQKVARHVVAAGLVTGIAHRTRRRASGSRLSRPRCPTCCRSCSRRSGTRAPCSLRGDRISSLPLDGRRVVRDARRAVQQDRAAAHRSPGL